MHSFANFNVAEIPRPRHSKKCQSRNGIFKNSNAHNSILLGINYANQLMFSSYLHD